MNFEKYVSSFKREEVARIWVHMTAMTLTIARRESSRSLLVVEGAEREDENGDVTTEPLILGEVEDKNRLKEVAELILEKYRDIAIEGKYAWSLMKGTQTETEASLWSICWTTTEDDYSRSLPQLLIRLSPKQIDVIKKSFPNPNDKNLLDLSMTSDRVLCFKSDDFIQDVFDRFISDESGLQFHELIEYIDTIEIE